MHRKAEKVKTAITIVAATIQLVAFTTVLDFYLKKVPDEVSSDDKMDNGFYKFMIWIELEVVAVIAGIFGKMCFMLARSIRDF